MRRRFITKQDIDASADTGAATIEIDDRVTVTDLAREHARARGVRLVPSGAPGTGGAPGVTTAGGVTAGPAGEPAGLAGAPPARGEGRPAEAEQAGHADLHGRVRAAVIAQLGEAPEGLDAIIARVLARR